MEIEDVRSVDDEVVLLVFDDVHVVPDVDVDLVVRNVHLLLVHIHVQQ